MRAGKTESVKILEILCRPSRGRTYVANTPSDSALLTGGGGLVRLTFYTWIREKERQLADGCSRVQV